MTTIKDTLVGLTDAASYDEAVDAVAVACTGGSIIGPAQMQRALNHFIASRAPAAQAAAAMAAEYGRWIGYFHRGDGDYNDFLRIELDHGDDLRTVRADACALGLKEAS